MESATYSDQGYQAYVFCYSTSGWFYVSEAFTGTAASNNGNLVSFDLVGLTSPIGDKAVIDQVLCKLVELLNVFPGRIIDDFRCQCGLTGNAICIPPAEVEVEDETTEETTAAACDSFTV